MAERERFRTDARAVRIGVAHGAVTFGIVLTFGLAVRLSVHPFLQLLNGALPVPIPGVRFFGGAAAVLGVLVGLAGVRRNRRSAGAEGRSYAPGASALERQRDRLADDGGTGLSEPRAVQRWDPGLLVGGDPRPVSDQVI